MYVPILFTVYELRKKAIWFSYWTLDYLLIMEWLEIQIYSPNKETPHSKKCLAVI